MEPHIRHYEKINYFLKNLLTNTHTAVLAYCSQCLQDGKEVSLESRLRFLERETRKLETNPFGAGQIRCHYEHTIACREGHELLKTDYWTIWKPITIITPFTG